MTTTTHQRYHQLGIIDQILSKYPDDVRFIFQHFPVITPDSPQLAEAAECAHDQGFFWEFHHLLFAVGPSSPNEMIRLADQLGLNGVEFESCFDSHTYAGLVESQMREAFQIGFRGTPSFTINTTPLAGPPSYEQLSTIVESMLSSISEE